MIISGRAKKIATKFWLKIHNAMSGVAKGWRVICQRHTNCPIHFVFFLMSDCCLWQVSTESQRGIEGVRWFR